MAGAYKIETLRAIARRQSWLAAAGLGLHYARAAIFGDRRSVFAMSGATACGLAAPGTGGQADGLTIRTYPDYAEAGPVVAAIGAAGGVVDWDAAAGLRGGAVLWVGFENSAPAVYGWARPGAGIGAYFFPMTDDCQLISHCATVPALRGRGHYTALLRAMCRSLAEAGARAIFIDCSSHNLFSRRGIESCGFAHIGTGRHLRDGTLIWQQQVPPSISRLRLTPAEDRPPG